MAAARHPWRPLGRLLVERGHLDREQLEHVLQEQSSTGERLGEILLRCGLITEDALAEILTEQSGLAPLAEGGFGTGLRAQLARRPAPDPVTPSVRVEEAAPAAAPAVEARPAEAVQKLADETGTAAGSEPGHLLFVQVDGRYELIERTDAPPVEGARIELPEAAGAIYVVARVGRSPLPADGRPCAWAESLPPGRA